MPKAAGRMKKAEASRQKAEAPLPPQAAALAPQSPIANRQSPILWAVLLVLVAVAVFWPATRCDFVNYDDDLHVTANLQVQKGLTWESVKWAALNPVNSIWHPLTVWSHMADCQLYGLNPWGHHLTSVLLHALNAGLVFVLLRLLTGATGRSLMVAALFALHPLRVESVAWVSERKDVLSGFFGLLSLIAYARYAQRGRKSEDRNPKAEAGGRWSLSSLPSPICYLLSLFFFALGLLSKPMLVTWPFVLLLLDYWPLGRMQKRMQNTAASDPPHATGARVQSPIANRQSPILFSLLVEKIPFFVLAALASVVTFQVQQRTGALAVNESLPLGARVGNALIAYSRYLGKLFWPADLAVVYPHPGQWPLGQVLLAGGLILGISALLWAGRRRCPYLLMGWLWYCGTLVPVSQVIQTGSHALADRYTYLPSLGALILLIWGAYELLQGKAERGRQKAEDGGQRTEDRGQAIDDSEARHATRDTQHVSPTRVQSPIANRQSPILLRAAGGAAIFLCLALTRQQLGYWKDSEALFRHALGVTENNALAHNNLGAALGRKGQSDEAIRQYQEALRLKPGYPDAHYNLGAALDGKGRTDEAIGQYQEALRLNPNYAQAHYDFGLALERKGQTDQALRQYEEAIRLMPDHAEAHNNLGALLYEKGQTDNAIRQYLDVIRLQPGHADAHNNLGIALGKQGQTDEAIRQFQEAIRLNADHADAHYNLSIALARKGQMDGAIRQYQEALRLKPDNADAHNGLGAALVHKGQMDEAIRQFQEVLRLQPDNADAHYNLGVAFYHQGRTDEAILQFQEVIRLKPEHAEAHNNLGSALGLKGQTDESIRQFQAALRLRPDYAEARKNLAVALTARGEPFPPPGAATNR